MLLIAGLGNPGAKYQGNRHNIGFMAVDAIYRRHSFSPWLKKFKAEIAEGELGGQKVLLIKPQTFMNLSGEAVGEAMRFYKLQPSDLVVIYDELDLPAGKARLKKGGGHGEMCSSLYDAKGNKVKDLPRGSTPTVPGAH